MVIFVIDVIIKNNKIWQRKKPKQEQLQTCYWRFPKVGIRPVIDGRMFGVRESLENQTMKMAQNAANLISSSLK
jgi:predicted P-loop ATPase